MKIIVCEFNQETNSFNPVTTKMKDYVQGGIYRGEEMIRELEDKPCAVAGMLQAIKEANAEVLPALSMYAQSGGPVEQEVLDAFLQETMAFIRQNMRRIHHFIHGATQSTQHDDVRGLIQKQSEESRGAVMTSASHGRLVMINGHYSGMKHSLRFVRLLRQKKKIDTKSQTCSYDYKTMHQRSFQISG